MDSKKKIIIVAAVVIVLIVAVFAAQSLSKDKDKDNDETATVTFLIQDNYGVYFWIDGEGKTVYDAFADAAEDFAIPFVPTKDSDGNANGINSLFGLEMKEVTAKNWVYWQQYTYTDGKWVFNEQYLNSYKAADCEYVAIAYGGYGVEIATSDVSKAVVWDKSTKGTLFTIESLSGMYFRVNGSGDTVFDAWESAMKAYNVPYEPSNWTSGKGVNSMFGIASVSDESGYTYWDQYVVDGSAWVSAPLMMSNLKSADYAQMLLVYGNFYGDNHPEKAPIY